MITVTGAARIFGALAALAVAASFAFASGLLAKMKRAGEAFADVGPIFTRS